MLKYYLLNLSFLFFHVASFCQEPKEILKQSLNSCQSIQNGSYEMTRYFKFMDDKDTSKHSYKCSFKKLKDDSIYSSAFHYKTLFNDSFLIEAIYTGEDLVKASSRDSTATIMSKSLWAKEIKSYSNNYKFYTPLTDKKCNNMPTKSDFTDSRFAFKLIGIENINGKFCYHIQTNKLPENDSLNDLVTLRQEYHYWINKKDFIPLQYSIAFDLVINNDTMYQYEKNVLDKYEINNLKDKNYLTIYSIPANYKVKDFIPFKSPELLKNGTIAPDWKLLSFNDEKVCLKKFEGQVVLVDFFYKACYPCIKSLPTIQALNEKYKNKGLQVIGIDPYDKKEDGIKIFISKHGITYIVLLSGKEILRDYHVSAFPTLYLIDKNGKIIFAQMGYEKGMEENLENLIKMNL